MIPEFPNFKKLELTDREDVEKFTAKFPPYSDFNFVSMWVWNIASGLALSQLNKNLVVIFNDYLSNDPFISFIGKNKISETVVELIKFSNDKYKTSALKLVPEEEANILTKFGFKAVPDRGAHDYVYSVFHLANMDAWSQNTISKGIRRFVKKYPDYVIKQNSIDEISKKDYLGIFKKWSENKKVEDLSELNEYKAFQRVFQLENKNLKIVSLYLKDTLIGFSIFEILPNNYAISHFIKADTLYHSSVYDVLNWEEAKILKNQGVKYYNWEQDLGIPGLRHSKLKYKPSFLLKQFIITSIEPL